MRGRIKDLSGTTTITSRPGPYVNETQSFQPPTQRSNAWTPEHSPPTVSRS
jgi:hypothetical protein